MSQTVSPPIDLVLVGHVLDAQGIRGLVKVKPYRSEEHTSELQSH